MTGNPASRGRKANCDFANYLAHFFARYLAYRCPTRSHALPRPIARYLQTDVRIYTERTSVVALHSRASAAVCQISRPKTIPISRLGRSTHRHTIGLRREPFSRLTEDGFLHRANFTTRFKACPQWGQRTIILKRAAATRSMPGQLWKLFCDFFPTLFYRITGTTTSSASAKIPFPLGRVPLSLVSVSASADRPRRRRR
jgi:hypothetical protein